MLRVPVLHDLVPISVSPLSFGDVNQLGFPEASAVYLSKLITAGYN